MSAPWLVDLREQGLMLDDYEPIYGTLLLAPGDTGKTIIASYRVRPYYKAAIASLGQAWDAAGNSFTTFDILCNGVAIPQYARQTVAIATPFGDTNYLPQPFWLPQLATIGVQADLASGASASANFTARMIVYYFRQDPNLQRLQHKPGYSHLPGGIMGVPQLLRPRSP